MTIRGTNFGPGWGKAVVTVGGVPCARQSRLSHREIDCVTPAGLGVRHRVVVAVGERYSREDTFALSYLSPVIASVTPRTHPAVGGGVLEI